MQFISEAYSLSMLYLTQIIVRLNREGYPLVRKKIKNPTHQAGPARSAGIPLVISKSIGIGNFRGRFLKIVLLEKLPKVLYTNGHTQKVGVNIILIAN